ncbi:patatin-like phospholipase family protein [Pseudacidovorax intermedius]|uniref:Membrane protein n=1 Tax=Pseudacidovorax intermedius TaxID=433924 RepID=A0A147H240_9BURK|nr:patatin-like phospholipase family protein [Pseudacidovorax intermedius]KTT23720.1 membrane protein [Pseudacidovorax intermedius]
MAARRDSSAPERPTSSPAALAADAGTVRALVLQGGGALGAYQAGVYEALAHEHHDVDWVAGVSIGAINAALIAGNPPERRVAQLQAFWQLVSSAPGQRLPAWAGERRLLGEWSANAAIVAGIPGFFTPRMDPSLLLGSAAPVLSYYDTTPLKATLERLVDFDRLNDSGMRFSVGAVNVRTGNSVYFDNRRVRIGPEHIMASGALPPGFAPVHIDGEDYWDGGVVSNTPLQYVLDEHLRSRRLLVLQVDLFSARGAMPTTLGEVMARQKDIQYSSRTRLNTDVLSANVNLQQALAGLLDQLPPERLQEPGMRALCEQLRSAPIDIVHLIHRAENWEHEAKDYEFSRTSVQAHWAAGLRDMQRTLGHPGWLQRQTQGGGVTTYDLAGPHDGRVRRPGTAVGQGAVAAAPAPAAVGPATQR